MTSRNTLSTRQSGVRIASVLVLILASFLFLSACSGKTSRQAALLGKWQDENGGTIEFLKDGTVILGGGQLGLTASGQYSIPEQGRLRLDLGGIYALAGPQVFKYTVSGGNLTLAGENGTQSKLKKVKS